jgi:hypothetical protein
MEQITHLELRDKYVKLCNKLYHACEEGKQDEEVDQISKELEEIKAMVEQRERDDLPDLP